MQTERDELVKRVFPVLRDVCEARGVVWGEVDLRWGITSEQAAEGRMLELCLEEVRECQPFFLGLLGERYGWVPDSFDPDLVARQPWLRELVGTSVTELEILHGVLARPSSAANALFYFRDPAYAAGRAGFEETPSSLQSARSGSAASESAVALRRERLRSLKERIRASGASVREDYESPQSLAELVLEDFTALIDRRFPVHAKPSSVERERSVHATFAQSRRRVYVERAEYFAQMDEHASGGSGLLAITGPQGIGKSALVSNWLDRVVPGRPPVVSYFVAASGVSATWVTMLRRLIADIDALLALDVEIPNDVDELRRVFASTLQRAAGRGALVLLIDGLDQLERQDSASALVWLPYLLPENIRLIVSTLPGPALEEIHRRGWSTRKVSPLVASERRDLLERYLREYGKSLPEGTVQRIVAAPLSGNPLFMRVMLDELRLYGDHETLERRLDALLTVDDIPSLYELVFGRWEADYERGRPKLVEDAMTALWGARRGLTEAEVLDLLSEGSAPVPSAVWSPLYLAAKHMLVNHDGLLGFAHRFAREAVERRYLGVGEIQRVHSRLADYFLEGLPAPRSLEEGPWQLVSGERWAELFGLISRPDLTLALARSPGADLHDYWSTLESSSEFRMIDGYIAVLQSPDGKGYDELLAVARSLGVAGHSREALAVYQHLEQACSSRDELQMALGWQAAILMDLGEFDDALELQTEQQKLCRETGNEVGLQISLGNRARILSSRGDVAGALELYVEQERVARDIGAPSLLAEALGNQADMARKRGDTDNAITLLREQEVLLREAGDAVGLMFALGNRTLVLQQRGEIEDALRSAVEQEELARRYGVPAGLQAALGNRASMAAHLGDIDGSLGFFEEQVRICREGGLREPLSRALSCLSATLSHRCDFDRQLALLDEAEQISRELQAPEETQHVVGNRVAALIQQGRFDEAFDQIQERERICESIGDARGLQAAIGQHATILWRKGDIESALELSARQEAMCRALKEPWWLQQALGNHGILRRQAGELERAGAMFSEQEQICRELGDADGLLQSLGNQGTLARERGDDAAAFALMEQVRDAAQTARNPAKLQFAIGNQAAILIDAGNLDAATELLEQQEAACREHGLLDGLRFALRKQVEVRRKRGEDWGARPLVDEHLDICRRLGDPRELADALGMSATALLEAGELDLALAHSAEQERLLRRLHLHGPAVAAQLNQAIVLARLRRGEEAVATVQAAIEMARGYGLAELESKARSVERRVRLAGRVAKLGSRLERRGDATRD
jgi:tetratricopeptide (TPR) repeat protein